MSSYKYMAENNTRVNNSRHRNRIALPYLKAVLESKIATENDHSMAQQGIKVINDFDSLLCKGYVSTGYQYDDHAVMRDMFNDTWQENESIRNGSNAADEAEAEIAHAIAERRAKTALDEVEDYFNLKSLINEALENEHACMMSDD